MDYVAKRWWFFALSVLVIVPGLVFLLIPPGLRLGIDFTGGSSLSVTFTKPVLQQDLRSQLESLGYSDAVVQSLGDNSFFIRTRELDLAEKNRVVTQIQENLAPLVGGKEDSFDFVSAVVAGETVRNSIIAVVVASMAILIYITWAFRNVPSPFRYGVCAVIALIHDLAAVIGTFAVVGHFVNVEVNAMFILGLLTVLGFSVHDTIVVFDRIRENVGRGYTRDLRVIVNVSVSETLGRSLSTSLTVLFTLLALLLFGGPTIQSFLIVLLAGIIVGTYSSIAIASALLVVWETREIPGLLRKLPIPLLRAKGAGA